MSHAVLINNHNNGPRLGRRVDSVLARRHFDHVARQPGKPPLPVWKNTRHRRGELRRIPPKRPGDRIAGILARTSGAPETPPSS